MIFFSKVRILFKIFTLFFKRLLIGASVFPSVSSIGQSINLPPPITTDLLLIQTKDPFVGNNGFVPNIRVLFLPPIEFCFRSKMLLLLFFIDVVVVAVVSLIVLFPGFVDFQQYFADGFHTHNTFLVFGQQNLPPPEYQPKAKDIFLVADTQLYKRLCPSVRPSVRPSMTTSRIMRKQAF